MKSKHKPFVTLVGAGPGSPDLLTLAGAEALKRANVVLYDALVHPKVLDYAKHALKIFVGKIPGKHKHSQEEINLLMVQHAFKYGHVVRLKGGDPFVFGRGAEELAFVASFGIESKVIPGISSVTSVPSRLGISLTERGIAESFWVITGTTKEGKLSKDLALAAQSTATVVVLMGVAKLAEIVSIYQNLGKEDTPIALIQKGFWEEEQRVRGSIKDIEGRVEAAKISNPAIMVIGEVARNKAYEEILTQIPTQHHEQSLVPHFS